jgi:hypothetical protein
MTPQQSYRKDQTHNDWHMYCMIVSRTVKEEISYLEPFSNTTTSPSTQDEMYHHIIHTKY